ncbi:CS domain protein (macronuclear) [Tetrahymena thermophila SB210]|uniref:CS domain protein n=1 Tax=Tetrahymena thermophila (strain SB210) TaxID=312017 RepID=I7MMC2_TETTS|nr:CS domain protein [Tetrahymena thermophila SB210]EAS04572.2 CS domain protein [Tetrahymena thermophila SB210]|eukprot:XP_001024817.2 CS domain protein [Tetrahymena thermophila SB210]
MKGQFLFSFLAIILLAQCQEKDQRCFNKMTLGTSEISFINSIKESIQNKETFDAQCLHILIERGYYKAAILLFEDYFLTNNIDLHESTLKLTQVQKRDLDKFIQKIMSANQAVQQIEPVLKWAQSEDNIFLHIKLSMRADSPACVHCKVEKIEITNSTLLMSAYGIQSHQPLRFYLNLTLYDEINPELSSWNEDSVGTLFFNLTKIHKIQASNQGDQVNLGDDSQIQRPTPSQEAEQSTQEKEEENQITEQEKNEQQVKAGQEGQQTPTQKEEENQQQQAETPQQDSQNSQSGQADTQKNPNEQAQVNTTAANNSTVTANNNKKEKESIANKIWLRLEKAERKKEFAIWWDIRDKYRNAMDEWDSLCAKERENKKKKTKQEKQTSHNQHVQNQQQQQQQQSQQQEQQEQQQSADNATQQQNNTIESKTDL